MFLGSGFTRTLCGSTWEAKSRPLKTNTISSYLTVTGRLGCCPAGSFLSNPFLNPFNTTTCDLCSTPGQFSSVDNAYARCQVCPAGKFSDKSGAANILMPGTCQGCPAGTSNVPGSTSISSCVACSAGLFSTIGSACQNCPLGKVFISNTLCTACDAGRYQHSLNQACQKCPSGKFNTAGSSSCGDRLPDGSGEFGRRWDGSLRNPLGEIIYYVVHDVDGHIVSKYGKIEDWDVSHITNMGNLFAGDELFNSDISRWVTSNVTKFNGMFSGATKFNSQISRWVTSKATTMSAMFENCLLFNSEISTWDVSKVESMSSMFRSASSFNSEISTWDVSKVESMAAMFQNSVLFNRPLTDFNTSNLNDMSYMFCGCDPAYPTCPGKSQFNVSF